MLANKHINKIVALITALAVCCCFGVMVFAAELTDALGGSGVTMEYESVLFDTSEVMAVNILMDESEWQAMLDNASAEEYYQCDVEINGKTFYRVGIRPKGNTSLSTIVSDPTTDRYSFKLEFDQYVDGQTCFGLDKLILNNNYADTTNMKEALIYDMFAYIGANASLYNYAKISINGEYWGVYLALEAVEDSFMLRNYGVTSGELYKPDSMNMGGGMGGGRDFADIGGDTSARSERFERNSENKSFGGELPEGFDASQFGGEMPNMSDISGMLGGGKGGFSMGGSGGDLNYTDDSLESYSTIWEGEVTSTSDSDHRRVVTALKSIADGTSLETYMDIDNLIKYMAVHIFSVNDDSLSGSMAHNYYLYEEDGRLNLIPWDYNLAFGGMGMSGADNATGVVNEAIDDAFDSTDFFDTLMADEEYHAEYYAVMQRLVDEYLLGDGFESFYSRTRAQLDALVETDPNAFFTYVEYLSAVETLYELVKLRGQSIDGQLNGRIPSTESEQRRSDLLIDASHLDLSVMGSMNTGGSKGGRSFEFESFGGGAEVRTELKQGEEKINTSAFTQPQMGGGMPEGFAPSQMGGGDAPAQEGGGLEANPVNPFSFDSGNMTDMGNLPGFSQSSGDNSQTVTNNLIMLAVCFALIIGALVFAKLYPGRPRRR